MLLKILSLKAKEEKQQSVLVPNASTKHPIISNTIMLHTRSYVKILQNQRTKPVHDTQAENRRHTFNHIHAQKLGHKQKRFPGLGAKEEKKTMHVCTIKSKNCLKAVCTFAPTNSRLHHQMHVCTIKSDNFLCVTILGMCALIILDRLQPEGQDEKQ